MNVDNIFVPIADLMVGSSGVKEPRIDSQFHPP